MPKVRSESNGLYERMCLLETGIYSVFWNDILERVNATSRKLQDPKHDLNAAVTMVVSQKRFVDAERETFTEYEQHGATLSGTSDYVQTRQRPRNVRFDYGPASDAELTPSQEVSCHQLHSGNRPICRVTCSPPICVRGTMLQIRFPW